MMSMSNLFIIKFGLGGPTMISVSKSVFKQKALELFRKVEKEKTEIIITDHGKPVLKLVVIDESNPIEELKKLQGTVKKYEKPLDPVGVDRWEVLK